MKNTIKEVAKSNLFFIKGIEERLKEKNFNKKVDKECTVLLSSSDISYCYDSISIIEKFYSKDGWKCKMSYYYRSYENSLNCYAFTFTNL